MVQLGVRKLAAAAADVAVEGGCRHCTVAAMVAGSLDLVAQKAVVAVVAVAAVAGVAAAAWGDYRHYNAALVMVVVGLLALAARRAAVVLAVVERMQHSFVEEADVVDWRVLLPSTGPLSTPTSCMRNEADAQTETHRPLCQVLRD